MGSKKVFMKIDLQWGFNNVRIKKGDVRQQEKKKETFRREELPGQFIAKKLFRWIDKQYDKEYQGRLERNWR